MQILTPVLDDNVDPKAWMAFLLLLTGAGLIKLMFATVLPLTAQEAIWTTYAQHINVLQPHTLPVYPLLIKGVSHTLGDSLLALRLPGVVFSAIVPALAMWAARPLVGLRQATWVGAAALVFPPLAIVGVHIGPSSLIAALTIFIFGLSVRALTSGHLGFWLAAGVLLGLGVCTDVRMVLITLSVLAATVLLPRARKLLKHPPFLLALAISFWGLVPYGLMIKAGVLPIFMLNIPGSLHMLVNIWVWGLLLITPLYAFCIYKSLRIAHRRALAGDGLAGAMLVFITLPTILAVVMALSGRIDVPLFAMVGGLHLIFVPAATEAFLIRAETTDRKRLRMALVGIAPIWALFTITTLGLHQLVWAAPDRFLPQSEHWRLRHNTAGWQSLQRPIQSLVDKDAITDQKAIVAVTGFTHAAQLRHMLADQVDVYHLSVPDTDTPQYDQLSALWALGEDDLFDLPANTKVSLVLPVPPGGYASDTHMDFYTRLCQRFDRIMPEGIVTLAAGRDRVALYTAHTRTKAGPLHAGCPLFPNLYIHTPFAGAVLPNERITITGLAAVLTGMAKLELVIDGQVVGTANYGFKPDDFHVPPSLRYDPKYPNIGFAVDFDPRTLRPGAHTLSLRATRLDGVEVNSPEQLVYTK